MFVHSMTDKRKTAVHYYQFVVYTPQTESKRRVGDHIWEITGHIYPYRKGKFDYRWLDAFIPPPQKEKKR